MTNMRNRSFAFLVLAALLVCSAASADPPARVGRLNLIDGSVSFMPGDVDGWTAATLNYPLTAGDSLWTEESSRAEVHVGSTAIRLGAQTELGFLELDDQRVRVGLRQGRLSVRLRELEPGESFAVDTAAMSVSLSAPGSYRIEVSGSGDTRAVVNQGEIDVVVDGLAYPARAGQAAFVTRLDPLSLRLGQAPARDGWDQWCAERDRREDRLASVQYVPRNMIGCEDLDWYGTWSLTVEFGPVWTPSSLPAGWAPYRYGRWAWVGPWGWTWIDNAPWGFAPFHYGRWALVHGRWVWVPGSRAQRPVYAPALVTHVEIGDRETIDASRIRYAHRDAGQASTVAAHREGMPSKGLLGAISRLAREWQPGRGQEPEASRSRELKGQANRDREPMAQQGREPRGQQPKGQQKWQKVRRKKTLANGQTVWVEELAPAGE